MNDLAPKIITIPAKNKDELAQERQRQLRVAAYCRVSTDDAEQLTSYNAQKAYYTEKIMTNPGWTMAGIFADEGITGTSDRKRDQFMEMIRQCKKKKIDIILVKSISRFARNTVDCLKYTRALRALGISVQFEKENINSLDADSEFFITLYGAFAQSESESISANVRWGKRQAMREGKATIQYKWLYAYRRGEDDLPEIIPEQAEFVRLIYQRFLAGDSLRQIKEELERLQAPPLSGTNIWALSTIRSILTNEKYCGDVLMQKSFITDCISKKAIRNTGQLPMYLVQNHHDGIVDRKTFDAVQAEFARRNAKKGATQKTAPTGTGKYSSKFALTERLICGECGTPYRRCTWMQNGKKRIVWRCINRLDYGKKYCHDSPTLDEAPLQQAILRAINSKMSDKDSIVHQLSTAAAFEIAPNNHSTLSLSEIEQRLESLGSAFQRLMQKAGDPSGMGEYEEQFRAVATEMSDLKAQKAALQVRLTQNAQAVERVAMFTESLQSLSPHLTVWEESTIRQLVSTVRVLSENKILVTLKGGMEVEQSI